MMWYLFQTLALMLKTCLFYVSGTLHARAGLSLHAHALWMRA